VLASSNFDDAHHSILYEVIARPPFDKGGVMLVSIEVADLTATVTFMGAEGGWSEGARLTIWLHRVLSIAEVEIVDFADTEFFAATLMK